MKHNWISVYLYSDLSFERVIAALIRKIVVELTNMDLIRSYFFIRYWEGGSHIRLRVLPKGNKSIPDVRSYIVRNGSTFYESQKDRQHYRIEFVPYEREVDRYSGKNGVKIAESIFQYSSMAVINIINQYESRWNNGLAIAIAIKMHVIFAKSLIEESESRKELFKRIFENCMMHSVKLDIDNQITQANIERVKKAFEKTFLEQKEKIVSIVRSTFFTELEETKCEGWEEQWLRCCQQVNVDLSTQHLIPPNQLVQYCENHIHMTNNRLGVYLRDESFIAFMIYTVFNETKICNN
ncbi:thiopeptide-type bacteriocin biosynthesis protein [Parapedobacter tibetensis]|uniref:thiopeptide-type bacteriocin biosynthesis protein n=1 Tax=Parapedobacter tibetensis TaxID=2972951 RepID=UPI00214D74A9|nr:thiopeptide-type bacteriocin biosynthesis protein [Parapedobacter tibetensis]